jgi:Sec-independent protein translocase protein TatA
MRIGVGQILVLLIASFLLFGDFANIRKKITNIVKLITNFFNENKKNQEKRDLNPCPSVLETAALPTELFSYYKILKLQLKNR